MVPVRLRAIAGGSSIQCGLISIALYGAAATGCWSSHSSVPSSGPVSACNAARLPRTMLRSTSAPSVRPTPSRQSANPGHHRHWLLPWLWWWPARPAVEILLHRTGSPRGTRWRCCRMRLAYSPASTTERHRLCGCRLTWAARMVGRCVAAPLTPVLVVAPVAAVASRALAAGLAVVLRWRASAGWLRRQVPEQLDRPAPCWHGLLELGEQRRHRGANQVRWPPTLVHASNAALIRFQIIVGQHLRPLGLFRRPVASGTSAAVLPACTWADQQR